MLLESGIYRLVYEYYETRILFGYNRYGDHLPSISRICDMFQMAPATVRNALSVLEKKGLIQVDARKTAKVIYKSSPAGFRKNAMKYFAPREAGIQELCESGRLLLEPLWEEGVRRWDEKKLAVVYEQTHGSIGQCRIPSGGILLSGSSKSG